MSKAFSEKPQKIFRLNGEGLRVQGGQTKTVDKPGSYIESALHELTQEAIRMTRREPRKILVIGQEDTFADGVIDYAVNVADRLKYDLVTLNVGPNPGRWGRIFSSYRAHYAAAFGKRLRRAVAAVKQKAATRGITCHHAVKFGDLGQAVQELQHEYKRIEFALTESETKMEKVTKAVTIPVFIIRESKGERIMAKESKQKNVKPIIQTLVYGMLSAVAYTAIFMNADTIMSYFTRGAWFAAMPIATVFLISYLHGSFANHLWSALGIEAPTKGKDVRPEAKRPVARRRPRPELRLNA